jgi:hypothetical protein
MLCFANLFCGVLHVTEDANRNGNNALASAYDGLATLFDWHIRLETHLLAYQMSEMLAVFGMFIFFKCEK